MENHISNFFQFLHYISVLKFRLTLNVLSFFAVHDCFVESEKNIGMEVKYCDIPLKCEIKPHYYKWLFPYHTWFLTFLALNKVS